jgi:uncharacterized surface protein with fasciclin (FAS1) repeats
MPSDSTNRSAFLRAAGLSLIGIPALAGMVRPSGVIHTLRGVGPDARVPLPESIAQIPDLSTLTAIINNTPNFYALIESGGPWTMFCPSNEAFSRLSPVQMKKLQNPAIAQRVLEYHLLSGLYKYSDFQTGRYTTVLGTDLKLVKEGAETFVNHALMQRQFPASNGEGHVIDKVLTNGFRGS